MEQKKIKKKDLGIYIEKFWAISFVKIGAMEDKKNRKIISQEQLRRQELVLTKNVIELRYK